MTMTTTETKYPENCPYVTGGTVLDCSWKSVLEEIDSDSNLEPAVEEKTLEGILGAIILIIKLIIALIEALIALLNSIADVIEEIRKAREGQVEHVQ